METLGERVLKIRKARGLTQDELAEAARMARTDIVAIEKGRLNLGAARLGRVAAALDVTVPDLRPEAELDQPTYQSLELRLEALAESNAEIQENQERALNVQQQMEEHLRAIREALGIARNAEPASPKPKRRTQ